MYIKVENERVIGLIKMGRRRLFVRDEIGSVTEIEPLCVLDFYVHESAQRHGYGKEIFEYMLEKEHAMPHILAYDKPSEMFLRFLRKHYGLNHYVPQTNNFVVFTNYFKEGRDYTCMQ